LIVRLKLSQANLSGFTPNISANFVLPEPKEKFVKKTIVILPFAAAAALAGGLALRAQSGTAASSQSSTAASSMDQNIQMLRQDIRSKKKQTVAANLKLTDAEAIKFWPIYDQYTDELASINNEKYAVIKQYADEWGNMSNDQALSLTHRALAVEQKVAGLRLKYVPIFNQVVPGTTVATFFQIERRLQAIIDLQLASQIPVVQAQE
jgi:hypothetical protein